MLGLQSVSVSWAHPGRGGERERQAEKHTRQGRVSVGRLSLNCDIMLEVSQALHNHVISFCGVKCEYSVGIA